MRQRVVVLSRLKIIVELSGFRERSFHTSGRGGPARADFISHRAQATSISSFQGTENFGAEMVF